ncbi:DUF2218 domain-containing protein [Streptacidiphilus fuscans]|uniref:DUF2218 domain-containing protein n=1 Tax=Streptacidiphilus fuscans TaxID=2789292 RepID=A0A931B5E4_9ACTN|nr:DUF2218 domain-containing protein [Streptacidiphilus fuscans]MBF9070511.1 DUF2218 domain-containing protein [Streptacidiphilus fuscans]
MPRSQARVATDRPHRYAKQLAAHLGRKIETNWDEETGLGSLTFGFGTATMTATPDSLLLAVEGDTEHLDRLEDVVGRHLVRFGTKDELLVQWQRGDGTPGTVQRNEESEDEAAS